VKSPQHLAAKKCYSHIGKTRDIAASAAVIGMSLGHGTGQLHIAPSDHAVNQRWLLPLNIDLRERLVRRELAGDALRCH